MAIIPNRGVEEAVAEVERVCDRPGMRTVMLGCWPHGDLAIAPEDDKLFGVLAERGITLNIHVSMTQSMPAAHKAKLPGYGRFFDAPNRMIEMVFAGVFDRFPELNVFFAETDFGWVPYVKEQIDNNYLRLDPVSRFGLQQLPSEYISRHFHFGYMTDTFGLRQPRVHGRRAGAVVERLPAHQRRLAALVAGDPVVDVGPEPGRQAADPRGQRPAPLRFRPLIGATAPTRSGGSAMGTGAAGLVDVVTSPERREAYLAAGWWDGQTLPGRVGHHAATRPGRPRSSTRNARPRTPSSWPTLPAWPTRCGPAGVGPGDVVSVQLPNRYETVVVAVAVLSLGRGHQPAAAQLPRT